METDVLKYLSNSDFNEVIFQAYFKGDIIVILLIIYICHILSATFYARLEIVRKFHPVLPG